MPATIVKFIKIQTVNTALVNKVIMISCLMLGNIQHYHIQSCSTPNKEKKEKNISSGDIYQMFLVSDNTRILKNPIKFFLIHKLEKFDPPPA